MNGIERIRVLASEIKDKPLLKIVEYLLSREDMKDKYLNEEKNLKQMVSFIKSLAQKQAKDGMAIIEDEVVYGWAIHYWDESNEELDLETEKEKTTKEKVVTNKVQKKQKQQWKAEGQLTLFDSM